MDAGCCTVSSYQGELRAFLHGVCVCVFWPYHAAWRIWFPTWNRALALAVEALGPSHWPARDWSLRRLFVVVPVTTL